MFTRRKYALLSLAAMGLLLGAFLLCNRSGREAYAQTGGDVAKRQPASGKGQEADREAIVKSEKSFSAAFEKRDARAVAAHWTENGEYTANDGTVYRGRAAIEKLFTDLFGKNKLAAKVEIEVDSIRFPSRNTAIEEGYFQLRRGKDPAVVSKYSVLHVRENGKWLMAVVRDWPGAGRDPPRSRLVDRHLVGPT